MEIVIVDDDPVQCRLFKGNAAKLGYQTQSRDSGDAGLVLLRGSDGARIDCSSSI